MLSDGAHPMIARVVARGEPAAEKGRGARLRYLPSRFADSVAQTDEKRPWLAAILAFLSPGLGHIYLREWVRAVLWFGLLMLAVSILAPETTAPAASTPEAIWTASMEMAEALSWDARAALLGVVLLSVFDAYRIATEINAAAAIEEGQQCPYCGRELDEEIDFCHWCTAELDSSVVESN